MLLGMTYEENDVKKHRDLAVTDAWLNRERPFLTVKDHF